jgi:hypothetical protein
MYHYERLKCYNNVFWKSRGRASIWYEFDLAGLDFRNNICLGISLVHGAPYDPAQHTLTNNLLAKDFNFQAGNPHNLPVSNLQNVDPQFKGITQSTTTWDMDVSDFELKSTSPAINKGYDGTYTPYTDFYGHSRNGVPDIGAFEFGGVTGFEHFLVNTPDAKLEPRLSPSPMHTELSITCVDMKHGHTDLVIFNPLGRILHSFSGQAKGIHYHWDGKDINGRAIRPGVYYYLIKIDHLTASGRIIKVR